MSEIQMSKLSMIACMAVAVLATPAVSHPEDEFGGAARQGIATADYAQQAIDKLIAQKKIPRSWVSATLVNFDFRTKNGVDQYVLTYENSAIKNPAERKLYIFMSTTGQFMSASHSLN